jgi:hypothetical protein
LAASDGQSLGIHTVILLPLLSLSVEMVVRPPPSPPARRYTIELRRWPKETGYALTDGIDGDDVAWNRADIDPAEEQFYSGGDGRGP